MIRPLLLAALAAPMAAAPAAGQSACDATCSVPCILATCPTDAPAGDARDREAKAAYEEATRIGTIDALQLVARAYPDTIWAQFAAERAAQLSEPAGITALPNAGGSAAPPPRQRRFAPPPPGATTLIQPTEVSRGDIRRVKDNLSHLGYYAGDHSSKWTLEAQQALQAFQISEGMTPADGAPTKANFRAVRREAAKVRVTDPTEMN